jgi:hypothetical protein
VPRSLHSHGASSDTVGIDMEGPDIAVAKW